MSTTLAGNKSHMPTEVYIQRAESLLPLLRRHAAQTEQTRQVHPDTVVAMKQAGLFRILQPRRLGGAPP